MSKPRVPLSYRASLSFSTFFQGVDVPVSLSSAWAPCMEGNRLGETCVISHFLLRNAMSPGHPSMGSMCYLL